MLSDTRTSPRTRGAASAMSSSVYSDPVNKDGVRSDAAKRFEALIFAFCRIVCAFGEVDEPGNIGRRSVVEATISSSDER